MVKSTKLIKFLKKKRIDFFCGVPDSILKNFSSEIENKNNNLITANEGNAVALASGYYLSTKKIPCIYMQNSGLGNAINPLSSLSHKKVYSIPSLLLIGWRGATGEKDEPQHLVKGSITKKILKLLNIKFYELKKNDNFVKLNNLIKYSIKNQKPVACLVRKNIIEKDQKSKNKINNNAISCYSILKTIFKSIKKKTYIVTTTGYTSRVAFKVQEELSNKYIKIFYMVGSMGHINNFSLGFSLNKKENVICIDGDGSFIMHLGSMLLTSIYKKKNFKYILLNNNAHDSVGSQSTGLNKINLKYFFKSLGINNFKSINKSKQLLNINNLMKSDKPIFLEIKTTLQTDKNLPRPKNLLNIKKFFSN